MCGTFICVKLWEAHLTDFNFNYFFLTDVNNLKLWSCDLMENGGDAKLGICVKNKEFIIMECNIFFTNHTCERFPHFLILYAIFKVIQLYFYILFKLNWHRFTMAKWQLGQIKVKIKCGKCLICRVQLTFKHSIWIHQQIIRTYR